MNSDAIWWSESDEHTFAFGVDCIFDAIGDDVVPSKFWSRFRPIHKITSDELPGVDSFTAQFNQKRKEPKADLMSALNQVLDVVSALQEMSYETCYPVVARTKLTCFAIKDHEDFPLVCAALAPLSAAVDVALRELKLGVSEAALAVLESESLRCQP